MNNNEIKISHDCFGCLNCSKFKKMKDGNISVSCKLSKKGYLSNESLEACQNYNSILFSKKKQEELLPYNIWVEITNKCNLKCKMCGQNGIHGYLNPPDSKMRRKDLPIEEWKKFIDDVKSFSPMINIRGGEPLLYPHIIEFMKYVKENNLFLNLETNATFLKKFAHDVAKYADHISISVDGPKDAHDMVRGVEGTYDRLKEGILEYRKALKELKIKKIVPPISLNCVIGVENYKYISEMVNVSKDLDVKEITLALSYYLDDDVGKEYEEYMKDKFGVDAIAWRGFYKEERKLDYELLIKNIRELLNNAEGVKFELSPPLTDEGITNWYKHSSIPVYYDRCYTPWFMVNVMPNGDVNFCCDYNDYIIGNITENSLLEIWFGEKAQKYREEILKNRFSICKRCGVNFFFPVNRAPGLANLRSVGKILKGISKIPGLKKKVAKYNFLKEGFY